MNDKNRVFYFMGATVFVALLIIGVMYISGDSGRKGGVKKTTQAELSSDPTVDIKKATLDLSAANVSPDKYSTITSKITAAFNQKLINTTLRESLQLELDIKYKSASTAKLDHLINADPVDINTFNGIISHLKAIGVNDPKFANYQSGLAKMTYYTTSLPSKVSAFTNRSFSNYNHNAYNALKNEVEVLPGLDPLFKKKSAVVSMQKSLLARLRDYNSKYGDYEMSLDGLDVNIN